MMSTYTYQHIVLRIVTQSTYPGFNFPLNLQNTKLNLLKEKKVSVSKVVFPVLCNRHRRSSFEISSYIFCSVVSSHVPHPMIRCIGYYLIGLPTFSGLSPKHQSCIFNCLNTVFHVASVVMIGTFIMSNSSV